MLQCRSTLKTYSEKKSQAKEVTFCMIPFMWTTRKKQFSSFSLQSESSLVAAEEVDGEWLLVQKGFILG